jgi:hypothetical protein
VARSSTGILRVVRKSGAVRWRIRWIDATGKRRGEVYGSEAAARAELRRRQVEADDVRSGRTRARVEAHGRSHRGSTAQRRGGKVSHLVDVDVGEYGWVYVDDFDETYLGFYDNDTTACEEEGKNYCHARDDFNSEACTEDDCPPLAIVYPYGKDSERSLPFECLKRFPINVVANCMPVPAGTACFYIVLLAPDLSLSRVKMGRTENLPARIHNYRTSHPTCFLVGAWALAAEHEAEVMDKLCAQASGSRIGRSEVFDVDLQKLVDAANALFEAPP